MPLVVRIVRRLGDRRRARARGAAGSLADWEMCYNTTRPPQALGYLTPAEYLVSLGVDV